MFFQAIKIRRRTCILHLTNQVWKVILCECYDEEGFRASGSVAFFFWSCSLLGLIDYATHTHKTRHSARQFRFLGELLFKARHFPRNQISNRFSQTWQLFLIQSQDGFVR